MDPRKFKELCMATGMSSEELSAWWKHEDGEWIKGWDNTHDDNEIYEDDGSVGGPMEEMSKRVQPSIPEEDNKPSPRKETYEMTDRALESEMSLIVMEGVRDDKGMDRAKEVLAEMLIRAWKRGAEGKNISDGV